MSEPYLPSNGTEGAAFIDQWCSQCARDNEMNGTVALDYGGPEDHCDILSNSYLGPVRQWIRDKSGPRCTAFVTVDKPIPAPRCERTGDMFEAHE